MTDNWPLETVLQYMDSDMDKVRWGAVFMAGKWADHEEVIQKLQEIARSDPDPTIRRLARHHLPNGRKGQDPKGLRDTLQTLQDLRDMRQQIDRAGRSTPPAHTHRITWSNTTA